MYFLVNIMSKRLSNTLFVSNNHFIHSFVSQNVHKSCLQLQTNESFCGKYVTKTCLSSANQLRNVFTDNTSDDELKKSIDSKFKRYSDEDSQVIYDMSEDMIASNDLKTSEDDVVSHDWNESNEELYLYQQKRQKLKPIIAKTKRGLNGVFDVEELVHLLRNEKMKDIAVIRVPEEMNYCQHLVLADATSKRHVNAFIEYFNKVYKVKKHPKDPFLHLEFNKSDDWKVIDLKNIVLHLFLKNIRQHYDIETLWTVGHEFDDKTQRQETDSVVEIMEKHIKFLQEIKPMN